MNIEHNCLVYFLSGQKIKSMIDDNDSSVGQILKTFTSMKSSQIPLSEYYFISLKSFIILDLLI